MIFPGFPRVYPDFPGLRSRLPGHLAFEVKEEAAILSKEIYGCPSTSNMQTVHNNSSRVASRRVGRALTLLSRASRQLDSASHSAPDQYHQQRLHGLVVGLRDLCLPLSKIASHLERGDYL